MLEQYIKNFAHGYIGLESEHLNKIELDEGLDEQGVPKSITFLPPKVGQEI